MHYLVDRGTASGFAVDEESRLGVGVKGYGLRVKGLEFRVLLSPAKLRPNSHCTKLTQSVTALQARKFNQGG